jgi:hypothetical protein
MMHTCRLGTVRGRWCHSLREDDGIAGMGTTQVRGGQQHRGFGDGACGLNGVEGLGSGKMVVRTKGLNGSSLAHGRGLWHGAS